MKKCARLFFLFLTIAGICFAEQSGESRADLSLYVSQQGEIQINFLPQWKFPFLQGKTAPTSGNNITLKLNIALSPIGAGLTGDGVLTVFPFLLFTTGAMLGTGRNYDLFGVPLVGLGLNRSNADAENGFGGAVWDIHAGATLQFDFAAFFPGDWNHVVMQLYNKIDYFAYTKAKADDLWYYLGDDGMNINSFCWLRHADFCEFTWLSIFRNITLLQY